MAFAPPNPAKDKFVFYITASFVLHLFAMMWLGKILPGHVAKEIRVVLELAQTPITPPPAKLKNPAKPAQKPIPPVIAKQTKPKQIPQEKSFLLKDVVVEKNVPASMFKENLSAKKTAPIPTKATQKIQVDKVAPPKQKTITNVIQIPKSSKTVPLVMAKKTFVPKDKLSSTQKDFAIRTEELFAKKHKILTATPPDFREVLSNLDKNLDVEKYGDVGYAGEGILSFADENFKAVWYGRIVKQKVVNGWFPPYAARVMGLTGRSIVTFKIQRDGKITDIILKDPSGNKYLDKAALFAIENAGPFPGLPSDYDYDTLGVIFSFWYNLTPVEG